MKASNVLVALSLVGLTGVAVAKGKDKEPNCDVNGKKTHVKDEKACTKKKGTWMPAGGAAAAAPAGGADTGASGAAPAGGATTTAPAGGAEGGAAK